MKRFILLLLVLITMSGCFYTTYRRPYYQRYPYYQKHYQPNKKIVPHFRQGRW